VTYVTLFWGKDGLVGLESRGHAGRGIEGEDIVCAAISVLVQTLLMGLRDVAEVSEAECEVDRAEALIRVRWPGARASELGLLTRSIVLSLREVACRYAEFVSISEVRES
jgi:uncharacterized protein YsxB (DUF464 family)